MTDGGGAYTCSDCGNTVVWTTLDTGCPNKKCDELTRLRAIVARVEDVEGIEAQIRKAIHDGGERGDFSWGSVARAVRDYILAGGK